MCDKFDQDGIHIRGLILNFFCIRYPTLVQSNKFLCFMRTPIVSISRPGKPLKVFYELSEAQKYIQDNNVSAKHIKYLKGLGSSDSELIPQIWGKRVAEIIHDVQADNKIKEAFSDKYADVRKEWLQKFDKESYNGFLQKSVDGVLEQQTIVDFVDKELILFSQVGCKRAIPCLIDGLKDSQRKILYSCLKKRLTYQSMPLKTSQLAGYCAENSSYHFGENNLFETIEKMAHDFVGGNNINLLDPSKSQMGSRLQLGKDSSAARYTCTRMSQIIPYIFNKADDDVLTWINDEGLQIEPEFYVPIVPMVLVNGTSGIGVGYSTNIPSYNLYDIIEWITCWISTKNDEEILNDLPMEPYYRGFKGSVTKVSECKWKLEGKIEYDGKNKYTVLEIPPGKAIGTFADELQSLEAEGHLTSKNYSTSDKVNFVLNTGKDTFKPTITNLKLLEYVHTSNMVLFDGFGKIKKYETPQQILQEFCRVRLDYYKKRMKSQIDRLKKEQNFYENKHKFVKYVIDEKLVLKNRKESDLIVELTKLKFDKNSKTDTNTDKPIEDNIVEDNDSESADAVAKKDHGFDYLLHMRMISQSKEEVQKLHKTIESIKVKLEEIENSKSTKIWLDELSLLKDAYKRFYKV